MSPHIFIANAASDKAAAERVTQILEARGHRCWMMPRDLQPGIAWFDAVIAAIDSAETIVILTSSASNESPEFRHIVEYVVRNRASVRAPIFALSLDDVPTNRGVGLLLRAVGINLMPLSDDLPGFPEVVLSELIEMRRTEGRSPPSSEPPGASAAPVAQPAPIPQHTPITSPQIDPVEFGVAHPVRIARDEPFTVGVWLFKREDRSEAEDRALAAQGKGAKFLSQGSAAIARGTAITVTVQIEGWRIEPEAQTVLWTGDITNVAFLARPLPVPDRFGHGMTCIGDGKIIVNGIRVAQIFFNLTLTSTPAAELAMATGSLFKTAFASYASHDRRRVLGRVQGIEKLGVKVFMDVHDLKPGAAYNQELFDTIDRSDVLYLFWSRRARESAYVEREWRYGLERRGMAFIDPVPLVDPRKVPPPAELAGEKHFADWTLAFIEYEKSASLFDRLRAWIAGD